MQIADWTLDDYRLSGVPFALEVAEQAMLTYQTQLIAHIGEASERSWTHYWQSGFSNTENPPPGVAFPPWNNPDFVTAMKTYTRTLRDVELHIHVVRGLIDLYLSDARNGQPNQEPPPLWRWHWDETETLLCLQPKNGPTDMLPSPGTCVPFISLEEEG